MPPSPMRSCAATLAQTWAARARSARLRRRRRPLQRCRLRRATAAEAILTAARASEARRCRARASGWGSRGRAVRVAPARRARGAEQVKARRRAVRPRAALRPPHALRPARRERAPRPARPVRCRRGEAAAARVRACSRAIRSHSAQAAHPPGHHPHSRRHRRADRPTLSWAARPCAGSARAARRERERSARFL